MRFTVAWANVVSENQALKIALGCLAVVLVVLSLVAIRLSDRKPLLIERACYSRILQPANAERTTAEIEVFVREALTLRFDSSAQMKPGFISQEEEKFRSQEQQEFKKKEISQKIIINSVSVTDSKVTVDADRLFTVGSVKSVLSFPIVVTIGTVSRTEWNQYGLMLLQVSAVPSNTKGTGGGR